MAEKRPQFGWRNTELIIYKNLSITDRWPRRCVLNRFSLHLLFSVSETNLRKHRVRREWVSTVDDGRRRCSIQSGTRSNTRPRWRRHQVPGAVSRYASVRLRASVRQSFLDAVVGVLDVGDVWSVPLLGRPHADEDHDDDRDGDQDDGQRHSQYDHRPLVFQSAAAAEAAPRLLSDFLHLGVGVRRRRERDIATDDDSQRSLVGDLTNSVDKAVT